MINPNNKYASDGTTLMPSASTSTTPRPTANHWLYVTLKGPDWDRTGIGSSLYATLNDGTPQEVTLRARPTPIRHITKATCRFTSAWGRRCSSITCSSLARRHGPSAQPDPRRPIPHHHVLPGDYNGDNLVDNRDYLVWRKGLGGEFTQDDYLVWRNHFGAKFVAGAGAVEGGAIPSRHRLVLLLSAMPLLFVRRR